MYALRCRFSVARVACSWLLKRLPAFWLLLNSDAQSRSDITDQVTLSSHADLYQRLNHALNNKVICNYKVETAVMSVSYWRPSLVIEKYVVSALIKEPHSMLRLNLGLGQE